MLQVLCRCRSRALKLAQLHDAFFGSVFLPLMSSQLHGPVASTITICALLDAASSSCNLPGGLPAFTPRTFSTRCPRRCRFGDSLAPQQGHSTPRRLCKPFQLARCPSPLDRYRQLHLSSCRSMTLTALRPQSHPDLQPDQRRRPELPQYQVQRALAPKAPV